MYKIVRLRLGKGPVVLKKGLTLEEAQKYCKDPETSSSTATSAKARAYTRKHGKWFDSYDEE